MQSDLANQMRFRARATGALVLACGAASAGPLTVPNAFVPGTPAVAAEVNGNFSAVAEAVNDNNTRVSQLEADNESLAAANAALTTANNELDSRIAELESFIGELRGALSLENDNQGNPAVVFSGVNVHVNNGAGESQSVNGLGNLIIGYDEESFINEAFCSIGDFHDNEAECLNDGGVFTNIHKTGSHTLVVGPFHNYSRYGGVLGGELNTVNGISAVAFGALNRASGPASTIGGGVANAATSNLSHVSGGESNQATGVNSSILGGSFNMASGRSSSISGGRSNLAAGSHSSVSGGDGNAAIGDHSTVGGGIDLEITIDGGWIAPSINNTK